MADLSSQGIPIQDDPLTTALDKCDINDSHEPTTLLSLPAELVDEIAWYLTPIRNLQYTGFKTPWYGDKPFDCWNADLENLSRVCRALRSGLVERQRGRVVVLTKDFEESLHGEDPKRETGTRDVSFRFFHEMPTDTSYQRIGDLPGSAGLRQRRTN